METKSSVIFFIFFIFSIIYAQDILKKNPPVNSKIIILSVPGVKQIENWDCGPTAAAMLLQFYGYDVDRKKIADIVTLIQCNFTFCGTHPENLHGTIQKWKQDAKLETQAKFNTIIKQLKKNKPVIALLQVGTLTTIVGEIPALHYICISGIDEEKQLLYFKDPSGEPNKTYQYSFSVFQKKWDWNVKTEFIREVICKAGVMKRTIIY